MVIKFISNKKGGSSKAVDYLLNEREALGTARTLQGDPSITRSIINNIERKQKVTVGVMSFEESNINEDLKYKLMNDLEKTMFPGMDKSEYNILWVEHTDKDRLELNFVVPKEHLPTQKALQPYYHGQDLPRFEKLQKIMNIENSFTDPQDPSKKRTLEINNKEIHLAKDYVELDNTLHQLVAEGKIQNRQQMVELLKENDIQVTREAKESLSIKLPDSKRAKRFKGDIYNEQFNSPEQLKEFSKQAERRTREYNYRDTQTELRGLKQGLEEYNTTKSQTLREQYKRTNKQDKTEQLQRVNHLDNTIVDNRNNTRDSSNDISKSKSRKRMDSTTRDEILTRREPNKISQNRNEEYTTKQKQEDHIYSNRREVNDSTRATATDRESEYKSPEYNAYLKARKSRSELHKTATESANSIRKSSIQDSRRELDTKSKTIEQSVDNIEAIKELNRPINRYAKLRERVTDYIESAQQHIVDKVKDFTNRYKKNFVFKQDDLEQSLQKEVTSFSQLDDMSRTFKSAATKDIQQEEKQKQQQEQQQSRSRGMSL